VKNLDFETEFGSIAADPLVIFRQRHWPEYLGLDLAAHIHAGAVDHQNFRHAASLS
jgi:hypothetical protein